MQQLLSQGPGDRRVEGAGPNERWIAEHETNRWYEVALPANGVLFTFSEMDAATREVVLSSVREE